MKTSEIKWLTMLLFTAMLFITACSDDTIRPPYLEEEIEPTPETKEFVVYDAMSYKNKPDLTSDMISNIRLIYEAFLLTNEEIDMDKVATQISITKTSNYQTVSTDIEAWYSNKTDEEIKTGLKTVFDAFKKEIPSCTVGNYGIPVSDLNVFRYNRTEPEEEIIKLWKKKSERRLSAGEVSDVLYPSLYIMTPDVDQWLKDLKTTVEYIKEKFPDKNTDDSLEKELKYCKQLIDVVKGNEEICSYPKVQEKLNLLEESVTDDMEHLETSKDEDAKTGHKTADTSFFGYKTHIAMTEERIITAATITSGEKTDGKELPKLVQKSKAAGIQIESVIGDMAYSEKTNIEAAKKGGYELIAKLNPVITQANRRKEDVFEFNKDAVASIEVSTNGELLSFLPLVTTL